MQGKLKRQHQGVVVFRVPGFVFICRCGVNRQWDVLTRRLWTASPASPSYQGKSNGNPMHTTQHNKMCQAWWSSPIILGYIVNSKQAWPKKKKRLCLQKAKPNKQKTWFLRVLYRLQTLSAWVTASFWDSTSGLSPVHSKHREDDLCTNGRVIQ